MFGALEEFAALYERRPIKDNQGGMRAPHMFGLWFMARALAPDLIVESGVWRGQSTWLLEQACPGAKLVSLDLNLSRRQYISEKAVYSDRDFSEQDWADVTDRSLVFFDDHQNAYTRLQQSQWFGFKHVIFEDNYPPGIGDCYSLKQAFAHAGFDPPESRGAGPLRLLAGALSRAGALLAPGTPQYAAARVAPNDADARMLREHLEVYCEFPPVVRADNTRWGDEWDDARYPTPETLLGEASEPWRQVFLDEAQFYTWMCYARLK